MAVLLVWDKDSYTGSFLVFTHVYVFYNSNWFSSSSESSLVHFPWGPGKFKIFIFITVQWTHQPHSNFWFPSFAPIPPLHNIPLVWPMSHNITAFVLGLQSTYEGEHVTFGLLSLANFT
jgi:hypothetical protein